MGLLSDKSISAREVARKVALNQQVRRLATGNADINDGNHETFLVVTEGLNVNYISSNIEIPTVIEIYKAAGINTFTIVAPPGVVIQATKVEGTTKSLVSDNSYLVNDNGAGIRLVIDRTNVNPIITLTLL